MRDLALQPFAEKLIAEEKARELESARVGGPHVLRFCLDYNSVNGSIALKTVQVFASLSFQAEPRHVHMYVLCGARQNYIHVLLQNLNVREENT